jgi:homoserine/homoserine lactone efflux protein
MTMELYLAFVGAVTILMLIPGPNVALIVANSVTYGTRYGLITVLGTSTAMVLQLGVTALGMTALLSVMAGLFNWLRWLGVAYLLYLGIKQWRSRPEDLSKVSAEPKYPRKMYARGLVVSLTNPKTLFFYGAFLPQFISPGASIGHQLAVLSVTFVVVAVAFDSGWAMLAGRLRHFLAVRGKLRNRITGGLLIGAGLGLAMARKT